MCHEDLFGQKKVATLVIVGGSLQFKAELAIGYWLQVDKAG